MRGRRAVFSQNHASRSRSKASGAWRRGVSRRVIEIKIFVLILIIGDGDVNVHPHPGLPEKVPGKPHSCCAAEDLAIT